MKYRPNFSVRSSVKTTSWCSVLAVFALLPIQVSAEILVSEIMYDAPGSDSKVEWVELHNTGPGVINISKWKFYDGSNHILNAPPKNGSIGTLEIEPGEFLVLASDAATFLSAHANISASVIDTVMNLSNDGGVIALLNASSSIQARASYASSRGGNGTGESLQLLGGTFAAGIPTPGSTNASSRLQKPSTVVETKKTARKTVGKLDTQILDGTSTVSAELVDSAEVSTSSQVAAAVVPLSENSSSITPWLFGVLALAVAGAGAVFIANQKKKGEWEIEEIE